MNFRTTIILAVIAGILAVLFTFLKPKPVAAGQVCLIKDTDLESVSEIALKKQNSEIVCQKKHERDKDKWYICKPISANAAKFVIDDILYSVKWAQIQNIVRDVKDLKEYGLDSPRFTASFKTPAKTLELKFGKESEVFNGNVFVQLEGSQVIYALAKSVLESLDKSVKDIREKHILQYEPSDIVKVKLFQKYLKGTQPYYDEVECERVGSEGEDWKAVKPSGFKVDAGQINRLVKDIKDLEIKDFLPQGNVALADFDLETPATKIEVYEKGQTKPLEFHFGKRMPADQNKLYGRNPTSSEKEILALDYEKFFALPVTIDSLRTTAIFDFKDEDVKAVFLTTQTEDIELGKTEEEKDGKKTYKWVLKKPNVTIKEKYIEPFINNILTAKVKDFMEKEPASLTTYGLDKPKCKLTFSIRSDATTVNKTYFFSTISEESYVFLKKDWDSQVYTVDRDFYQLLKQGTMNLLDNVMLNIDKANLHSIACEYTRKTLAGQDISEKYVCVYDEGAKKWKSQEPPNREIDEGRMNNLVEKISHIETKMLLSRDPKDIPNFKLNTPDIKVTIKYKEDAKEVEKTLLIALLDKTHHDGKLTDSEIIFKLATDVAQAIMKTPYEDTPY